MQDAFCHFPRYQGICYCAAMLTFMPYKMCLLTFTSLSIFGGAGISLVALEAYMLIATFDSLDMIKMIIQMNIYSNFEFVIYTCTTS